MLKAFCKNNEAARVMEQPHDKNNMLKKLIA